MRRNWLSEYVRVSAVLWTVVSIVIGFGNQTCEGQTPSDAAEEYLLVYGQGPNCSLHTWRTAISSLVQEMQGIDDLPLCEGIGTICMKNAECSSDLVVLEREGNLGENTCSILVYRRTNGSLSGVEAQPKNEGVFDTSTPFSTPETGSTGSEKPTTAEVWGFGILAVSIISLSGLFGALFWPLMKTQFYAQLMWILIGLAVGSLTASATFQLIPEGFKLKDFNEDYLTTAVFMWSSFWALYMFEALSKICLHSTDSAWRPQDSDHVGEAKEAVAMIPLKETQNGLTSASKTMPLYMSHGSIHALTLKKASPHQHSHGSKPGLPGEMAPVAWMIIIGDGIHNFIDGMSIGAGFSRSIAVGTSISIAIACEEFPHELGDFAILINSGMSVRRALCYNFLSACTAFAGLALGILLGEIDGSIYIFAFAGGLFLYIALTNLMPELNEMIATGLATSKKTALFVLLLQNIGIFIGATILYLVTRLPINIS